MLFTIDILVCPGQKTPRAKANENEVCRQLDRISLTRLTYAYTICADTYMCLYMHTYVWVFELINVLNLKLGSS